MAECTEAAKIKMKEYYEKNKEARKAQMKDYNADNYEKIRDRKLIYQYGIINMIMLLFSKKYLIILKIF
jgi:hypothetical protein